MDKIQIKMPVHELEKVDVSWLSIVTTGANRVPFRITKSAQSDDGKEGINMSMFRNGLFGIQKAAEKAEVVSYLVKAGANLDAVKARIESAGGSVDDIRQLEDGASCVVQSEPEEGTELFVLKFDEDTAAVLVNAKKFFESYADSTAFSENIGSAGFFPGLSMAFDAMWDTAWNILQSSDDTEEAVQKMESATSEFSSFISGLTRSIPQTAIKMEQKPGTVAQVEVQPDTVEKTEDGAEKIEKTETEKAPEANAPESVEKSETEKEESAETVEKTDDAGTRDAASEGGEGTNALGAILKGIEDLNTSITSIRTDVDGLKDGVAKAQEAAEGAVNRVEKSEETLRSAVGGVLDGDSAPTKVEKSAEIPLFDTAMDRV